MHPAANQTILSVAVEQWLPRLPLIIGAATLLAILTTTVHEWGYFSEVGPHFQSSLTTTDYLTSSLVWLPASVSIWGLWIFLGLIAALWMGPWKKSSEPVDEEVVSSASDEQRTSYTLPLRYAILGSLFMLSVGLLTADVIALFFSGLMIFIAILWRLSAQKRVSEIFIRVTLAAVAVLIPFAGIFGFAQFEARENLRSFTPVYRLVSKDGASRHVVMLRNIERGVLIHDPINQRVEFLKWDELRSISKMTSNKLPIHQWACSIAPFICPAELTFN